ncbi:hypothetical protein ACFFQW_14440 [Umezawaea endophytica]|uniref:Fido domain-containing protein n=1 Tax=Umezawaea endophytica TaxID=1654476 RepID=A0A9X2VJQ3_9PSEU|nr:hypothetical protein [Umezawaea endophytica]MCS7477876.1 hypothetical protein [Umezawaea endophytica]
MKDETDSKAEVVENSSGDGKTEVGEKGGLKTALRTYVPKLVTKSKQEDRLLTATAVDQEVVETADADPAPSLSGHVPRKAWWLVYINPKDHARATKANSKNPGLVYDTEQSPGYQQSMEKVFRMVFEDTGKLKTLNSEFYATLHGLAIAGLDMTRIKDSMHRWSTGDRGEGLYVRFPLSHDENRTTIAADLLTETIDVDGVDEPVHILAPAPADVAELKLVAQLARKPNQPADYVPAKGEGASEAYRYACLTGVEGDPGMINVNYRKDDAPKLVDAVGARFGQELADAGDDGDKKLAAIGKLIRALHVLHPFEDANGRTNITLLLTKLLLDSGFKPAILSDMDDLFSGSFTVDEIVSALKDGFDRFDTEVAEELARQERGGSPWSFSLGVPAAIMDLYQSAVASCTIL